MQIRSVAPARAAPRTGAFLGAFVAAGVTLLAGGALAATTCGKISVQDLSHVCLDGPCPAGKVFAYKIKVQNSAPEKMFISFRFRRPDGARVTGGLAINPNADTSLPLGVGPVPIVDETVDLRLARLSIPHCGTDPAIRYRWR